MSIYLVICGSNVGVPLRLLMPLRGSAARGSTRSGGCPARQVGVAGPLPGCRTGLPRPLRDGMPSVRLRERGLGASGEANRSSRAELLLLLKCRPAGLGALRIADRAGDPARQADHGGPTIQPCQPSMD